LEDKHEEIASPEISSTPTEADADAAEYLSGRPILPFDELAVVAT
jgi:hypothetical protein